MANSKYEYSKYEYESKTDDEIDPDIIIVVRVVLCDFSRFDFEKPNDVKALELMNECAKEVLQKFPEVIFSYGYRDEYSFIFKKETKFYQRRRSKINSIVVSSFSSIYVTKWNGFFLGKDLRFAPSFLSRVICCTSSEMLQAYLVWRQTECHVNNQHDTCLWQLINSGEEKEKAEESLKNSQKGDRNEWLYKKFDINYAKEPAIFRQGTCTLKTEVEEIVKLGNGCSEKILRKKVVTVHAKNIASREFWNGRTRLVKEVGEFTKDANNPKQKYLRSFQRDTSSMAQSNWIVVRIDGCHFHKFSDSHEFEKPNDVRALNLMNACAIGVLEKYEDDVVFCYGVSDEYSFVIKKDSKLYERRASDIVSAIVSLFTSLYTMKWKEFFSDKNMEYPPYFDGRAVCYPSSEILRDYLSWRQVDCHINNQYNTCFWMLVKSGQCKTGAEAQKFLKGTGTAEKNKKLDELSGVCGYYNTLPLIFRNGSSVFWKKEEDKIPSKRVVVMHGNIIEPTFWKLNQEILGEENPSSPVTRLGGIGIAFCICLQFFLCVLICSSLRQ